MARRDYSRSDRIGDLYDETEFLCAIVGPAPIAPGAWVAARAMLALNNRFLQAGETTRLGLPEPATRSAGVEDGEEG